MKPPNIRAIAPVFHAVCVALRFPVQSVPVPPPGPLPVTITVDAARPTGDLRLTSCAAAAPAATASNTPCAMHARKPLYGRHMATFEPGILCLDGPLIS